MFVEVEGVILEGGWSCLLNPGTQTTGDACMGLGMSLLNTFLLQM